MKTTYLPTDTNRELVVKRFFNTVVNTFGYETQGTRYFNYPQQRLLSESDILEYIEAHYSGLSACRVYLGEGFYIEEDFYSEALKGMLRSFEKREEYEMCNRIARLLFKIQGNWRKVA